MYGALLAIRLLQVPFEACLPALVLAPVENNAVAPQSDGPFIGNAETNPRARTKFNIRTWSRPAA